MVPSGRWLWGEVAPEREPGIESVGQRQAKPVRVLPQPDKRSQHDVVVVRRALALHAVFEDVRHQVLMEGVDRVREATIPIDLRQRHRRDEERVRSSVRWLRSGVRWSFRCAI